MTSSLVTAAASVIVPPFPTAAASTPLVANGKWGDPAGAQSSCSQAATTVVACEHTANAGSADPLMSTCRTESVRAGGVAAVGSCRVSLRASTSGPGRIATDGFAPGCHTFGLMAGTVDFSDSTGFDYPAVPVSVTNAGGVAVFSGSYANAGGIVVAHAEGSFALACGSPFQIGGNFVGTYTTV